LEILKETGAMYKLNKKGNLRLKATNSEKYRSIIKPLHEEKSVKD